MDKGLTGADARAFLPVHRSLPNTPGYLAGWIADPQHIKPGNHMPATGLRDEELQAVLAYLETLK